MTDGATRRIELINRLKQEKRPLSGTELAKEFGVSRQVIVQDIALLRATNRNILSTNKGYVLYDPEHGQNLCRRIFAVNHTDAQMQEELYLICLLYTSRAATVYVKTCGADQDGISRFPG